MTKREIEIIYSIKHIALRMGMILYGLLFDIIPKKSKPMRSKYNGRGLDILLTGTFYSDNWILTHLLPLAESNSCRRIRFVATNKVPQIKKVEAIYPPALLIRIIGKIPARLLVFLWEAIRRRPDIVGGFHLLPNGLAAAIIARIIGAKSLYFCGGGPIEVIGGGYLSKNRIFGILKKPDPIIAKRFYKAISSFDLVITMGSSAAKYFERYKPGSIRIVPGGFDGKRYSPSDSRADTDLIIIGRITPIKRLDIYLQAIRALKDKGMNISAIVVGDGPDRNDYKKMAEELGLKEVVKFVGHQNDIEKWLKKSKLFVLTSDSEGLSQALIQAMLCGLPAVVSDVGDLKDLVIDGVNGYLVPYRIPQEFAKRFSLLLEDETKLSVFGKAARQAADPFKIEQVAQKWDEILLRA